MARQLDPAQLQCEANDGRLAVAFGQDNSGGQFGDPEWSAYCSVCLAQEADNDHFVYVRLRDDPGPPADATHDAPNHGDDDPALKFPDDGADN